MHQEQQKIIEALKQSDEKALAFFSALKAFLYVSTRNDCIDFLKYAKRASAFQKELSYLSKNKEEKNFHIVSEAELLI